MTLSPAGGSANSHSPTRLPPASPPLPPASTSSQTAINRRTHSLSSQPGITLSVWPRGITPPAEPRLSIYNVEAPLDSRLPFPGMGCAQKGWQGHPGMAAWGTEEPVPGTPEAGRTGGPLSSSGHAWPRTQSLSARWEENRNTLMRRRRLRGTPLEDGSRAGDDVACASGRAGAPST